MVSRVVHFFITIFDDIVINTDRIGICSWY